MSRSDHPCQLELPDDAAVCPGSGQRTDRVHNSGAIVCPYCHGAYHASGLVLPEHKGK